jgi:excisionase family DNA binding protein
MATVAIETRTGLKTIPEVAAFLAVSRSKVYEMMDSGQLAFVKLGRSRRIRWEDVLSLVDENVVGRD